MANTKGYGQFCPVAKAAEIVAERWTPLIVRELICGSHRFSDLRKGVPLMSPSLLSQRLKELVDAGVVERRGSGRSTEYRLTDAGWDLKPLIEQLGLWGHQWARQQIQRGDLDPSLLMWDIRRFVDPSVLPDDRRTVVRFQLSGVPNNVRRWWLVFDRGETDLCLKDPGYEVDLHVRAPVRALVDVWLGYVDLKQAIRDGSLELEGPNRLLRSFSRWFALSRFAHLAKQSKMEAHAPAA